MIDKSDFFPIGIGTFGIGGMMERNASLEEKPQTDALKHSFEKGQNYLDMSFLYAEGHAK